jgi:hypothetical protein
MHKYPLRMITNKYLKFRIFGLLKLPFIVCNYPLDIIYYIIRNPIKISIHTKVIV